MINNTIDVRIVYTDEIGRTKGLLTEADGKYIIAVNDKLNKTERLVALWHEITHLVRDDLNKSGADVSRLEEECYQDMIAAVRRILTNADTIGTETDIPTSSPKSYEVEPDEHAARTKTQAHGRPERENDTQRATETAL